MKNSKKPKKNTRIDQPSEIKAGNTPDILFNDIRSLIEIRGLVTAIK
jgi:hypothetical protein